MVGIIFSPDTHSWSNIYSITVAGFGNSDLYFGHDVHKTQHWRLLAPFMCQEGLRLDYPDQFSYYQHLEYSSLFLEPLPVQTSRNAMGLQNKRWYLRKCRPDRLSGLCHKCHDSRF